MCVVINHADEVRKAWGTRLRTAREDQGLTQAALAERTGIDHSSVCRVEGGQGSLDSTIRLAKELGVSLEVVA